MSRHRFASSIALAVFSLVGLVPMTTRAQALYVYELEDGQELVTPIARQDKEPVLILTPQRSTSRATPGHLDTARTRTPDTMSEQKARIVALVRVIAPEHGLDPSWVLGVIEAESNFDPTVVSPVGAKGLMQLMPRTSEKYGAPDPFDPAQNIQAGCALLARLHQDFGDDWPLVLAAYSTGPARVRAHGGVPEYSRVYIHRVVRARQRWLALQTR